MKKLVSVALVLCMLLSVFAFTATAEGDKTVINVTRCTFNLATPDSEQVKKVEDAINAYIALRSRRQSIRIVSFRFQMPLGIMK